MASRHYNVPYNPRDWGPVAGALASTGQSSYPQSSSSNSMRRVVHRPPQNDPGMCFSFLVFNMAPFPYGGIEPSRGFNTVYAYL